MARLRLFAGLREIAGTARVDVPAETVGEVVEIAKGKFGPDFEKGLASSRIWLNGEEATSNDVVSDGDEVVILPPVSGGSQPISMASPDILGFLPLVVAVVAVVANLGVQEVWAAALVAIVAVWAVDLEAVFRSRARAMSGMACVAAATASILTTHVLGPTGYGLATALAVLVSLGWAVAVVEYRQVSAYAPTLLVSLLATLGASSMILSRSAFSPDERAVDVFLVAVIAGVLLGSVVTRLPPLPLLDRFTSTAVGAVGGALVAASLWDLDVAGYLLVGLGVAVALVAGQGLSSMMRTGAVTLTERPPGYLASLDGVLLAAAIYFPLVRLVL